MAAGARPRSQRYVRCVVCDTPVTLNNITTHYRNKHPDDHRPRARMYSEIGEPVLALEPPPPDSTAGVSAVAGPVGSGLPPLDLDDIVLAVTQQITEPSGLLPVAHLPALFAWREATATFLRSVSRQ